MRLLLLAAATLAAVLAPVSANASFTPFDASLDGKAFTTKTAVRDDDKKVRISYTAKRPGRYEVQQIIAGKWKTINLWKSTSSKKTTRNAYPHVSRLAAKDAPKTETYRVRFTPEKGIATNSRTQKVRYLRNTIMATPGTKAGFMYLDNAKPSRWMPCTTITYSVDVTRMPSDKRKVALADAQNAVAQIASVSGLTLRYTTAKTAKIRIVYKNPASASAAGTTQVTRTSKVEGTTYHGLTSATILMRPSLGDKTRRGVLLHETIHAIGIGHSPASDSIMKRLQSRNDLSAGDRKVIGHVGAGQGCF